MRSRRIPVDRQMSQLTQDRRKTTRRIGGERRAGDAALISEALNRRGRIVLRVHGVSMLPWVRPQDIAIIRRAALDTVRCGDLVLFRRNDQLFVHRIVAKGGALDAAPVFAKGDAHVLGDGAVLAQELLGRVVRIYRYGRRIDLNAPGQLALGVLIAQLSANTRFLYPAARFAEIVTRPARRLLQTLHVTRPTDSARY